MSEPYLHGVRVDRKGAAQPPAVRGLDTSIVGLVGTAPGLWTADGPAVNWADAGDQDGKNVVNRPLLVRSLSDAAVKLGGGGHGTLVDAIEAVLAQAGTLVVVVNVFDAHAAGNKTAVAEAAHAAAGDVYQLADEYVLDVVVKEGVTAKTLGDDYTVDQRTGTVTRLSTGSITAAASLNIAYSKLNFGAVTDQQVAGTTDGGGNYTGTRALRAPLPGSAAIKPKILAAPGHSHVQAVADELVAACDVLLAFGWVEGPDTTDDAAKTYRQQFSSRRIGIVDPGVRRADGRIVGGSAFHAGAMARNPFWVSPSNQALNGVAATTRPVDFSLSDPTARAQLLNAGDVGTIVQASGWRTFGGMSASADEAYRFIGVARSEDAIEEALLQSHLWAVDRNIGRTYFQEVASAVNDWFLRKMAEGAFLGGECVPADRTVNTDAAIKSGKAYWDVDYTPAYPAETLTFRLSLVDDYIARVFG